MRATTSAIQEFSKELHNHALLLNSLKEQFSTVKSTVENLAEIVQGARGGRPLTTRMELLQREVENMQEWIDEQKESYQEQQKMIEEDKKEKEEIRRERAKQKSSESLARWKVWGAITVAIISLMGTILGFFFKN